MVPWRCSVRTAAPTRGARCGRFCSAIMRSPGPVPTPTPGLFGLPPPTPGGGSNTISGRSAPIPIPTPTPGLFGLPPPTPGGGFEMLCGSSTPKTYSPSPTPTPGLFGLPPPTPGGGFDYIKHYHSTHLLFVRDHPRTPFCLCSAYRLHQAKLRYGLVQTHALTKVPRLRSPRQFP